MGTQLSTAIIVVLGIRIFGNAAALPKMRIPSTTMMAVDNWVPTPSWSPT
ncbi:hypothetical protein MAHJHV35_47860 [Mycobacterium avium subsp. hominissuis]